MRVLIASSATGGHIYPALAIAEEIKKRDAEAEFLFVGAKWEIGRDIVGSAGYRQEFIDVSGFSRSNPLKNVKVLRDLARASGDVGRILGEFRPDACIGTGGHVSGPVIRAAKKAGIRTMIQEQNVIPGIANRLAERYADKVFVGFEGTAEYFKDREKVVVSGNPVRPAFAEAAAKRADIRKKHGVAEGAFCALFFGGSQGAGAINDAAVAAAGALLAPETAETAVKPKTAGAQEAPDTPDTPDEPDTPETPETPRVHPGYGGPYHFIVITGREYYSEVNSALDDLLKAQASGGFSITVMGYSDEIYELFAAADLIVARAGALTVTEIAHSGKASILIPSPNVTNNHQYYNAKALADAGAAVLMTEEELQAEPSPLLLEIEKLAAAPEKAAAMGVAAAGQAKQDSAKVIVDELFGS